MFKTETKKMFDSSVLDSVHSLPILKGMTREDIEVLDTNGKKIKKPINPMLTIMTLGVLGIGGYFLATKVIIPIILPLLTAVTGAIAVGALVMLVIALFPVYKRWLSNTSEKLRRRLIRNAPFIVLQQKLQELLKNKEKLSRETANIKKLQYDSENKSYGYEQEVKRHHDEITLFNGRVQRLIDKKNEFVSKMGGEENAKMEDEYYVLDNDIRRALNDASRTKALIEQKSRFIILYGNRGSAFKKLYITLNNAKESVDETIKDFELSITMLEDEFRTTSDTKRATQSAKTALGLTTTFEVEYAIDVVNNAVSQNISETMSNLDSISKMTKNIDSFDPEEQLAILEDFSKKIEDGLVTIPSSKEYKNIDRVLTQEDKFLTKGFNKDIISDL